MKMLTPFAIRTLIVFAAFLWILSSLGEAATIQVDCSSASLQATIDKAKPGDTLLVSGTCKESLVIYEEVARITLDGQRKATIEGPDEGKPTIEVRGRGITIKGFTVTGGRDGISVIRGGQAIIDGSTVQGAALNGIFVRSSSARITNNKIQNNRRSGIGITNTSAAWIGNNTVKNNGTNGMTITNTSAAWVGVFRRTDRTVSPNIIENNERTGIAVNFASSARIVGNTIRNNKRTGIGVSRASSADISSNTIDGNGHYGIYIRNAVARLGRRRGSGIFQLPNSTTSNNSRSGVRCRGNSSVAGRLGNLKGNKGAKNIDPSCVDSLYTE